MTIWIVLLCIGALGLASMEAPALVWLACPASNGVTGNVVRVCGQSLLGA